MKKIVVGICDDVSLAVRQIEYMVRKYIKETGIEVEIHTFANGKEVLKKNMDILFLDIEMPEMDGIEVGREIRKLNSHCKIIMATSRLERFKETFKIGAFRFVSKPFSEEEVFEALSDAMQTMIGLEKIELYENRLPYLVKQRDISVIISYGSYIEVKVGKKLMRKDCMLSEIEKELDKNLFYQIDRKYIVNMLFIERYNKGMITIGGEQFQVSRRRKKMFEKAYWEFDILYGGE